MKESRTTCHVQHLLDRRNIRLLLVENIHLFLQPLWPRPTVPVPNSVIRARSSTILHFFSIFASRVYRLFSFHIIRHFPSIFLLPLSPITIFKWDDSQEYFAENKYKNFPVQFLLCDFSISSDFFIFKTDSPLFFLPPCPLFSKNIR